MGPRKEVGPREIEFERKLPNGNTAHHQTKTRTGFVCVQGRRAGDRGRKLGFSRLHLDCGGLGLDFFQLGTQLLRLLFGSGETGP